MRSRGSIPRGETKMAEKTCTKCHHAKPLSAFSKSARRADGLQVHCKECQHTYYKGYYPTNKHRFREAQIRYETAAQRMILAHLLEHPCVDCRENDPIVLDFDHVRGQKRLPISAMLLRGFALKAIEDEIKKCDVRCANCHRRRTASQLGFWKIRRTS